MSSLMNPSKILLRTLAIAAAGKSSRITVQMSSSTVFSQLIRNYSASIDAGAVTTGNKSQIPTPKDKDLQPNPELEVSDADAWMNLPDKLYKTIEIELLGYEPNVLNSYQWFILTAASHLGINVESVYEPVKSDKFRFNLLRSVFVHKKHQVHYEVRTYHRFITLAQLTGSTASTYLEYIQRNIPESVGMKVTKVEVLPMPDSLQTQ